MRNDPKCQLCRLHQTTNNVCILGQGPRKAEVMIVGEAPGRNEENQGKPFVGQSGQLLRHALENHDIDDVFITNAVSCRPPDNRTPTKGEIKACKKWLDYQIATVNPKYVLLLGNVPLMSVTGAAGITKKRGRPFEQEGIIYLPTFHPAFVLRDERMAGAFNDDLRLLSDIIEFEGIPEERELDYRIVSTWKDVREMCKDLRGIISSDLETNSLYPWQQYVLKKNKDGSFDKTYEPAKVVSIGFGTKRNQWIIPANHPESPWTEEELQRIVDRVTTRLENCKITFHNGKFDCLWMWVHFGVIWINDFDTMLAHYIHDENDRHGLKYLAQLYLGAPDWEINKTEKQGQAPFHKIAKYHAHDLYYTLKLRKVLFKLLKEDWEIKRVFDKILMPCARLFVEIEYDGVYIDETLFDDAEEFLREEYNSALKSLKKWEPEYHLNAKGKKEPFNWGSPKQLGDLLFNKLKIPVIERTKTGAASCSESVIKRIDHPCTGDLLRFRTAKQQLSFFIDGWRPYIHRDHKGDPYLHPSFKLHGTVTGRLSCENPNLQQVPRDPRIRALISAPEGWELIECDLSQIELRIAAELANERNMLEAFVNGVDVHWLTMISEISRGGGLKDLVLDTARTWAQNKKLNYSESIQVLLEMGPDNAAEIRSEWKENRKKAKAINFGYLYGMWWKKFKIYARDNYGVNVTDEEAEESREAFFEKYGFDDWHKRQGRYARNHGYVKSLSGRKRRLPAAMHSYNTPERKQALRQAINSPVQSFANEINLMTAIQLREEYPRSKLKMCGTVHDAILMRARTRYVKEIHDRCLEIMKRPRLMDEFEIDIYVPLEGEGKVGPWGKGQSIDKWLQKAMSLK